MTGLWALANFRIEFLFGGAHIANMEAGKASANLKAHSPRIQMDARFPIVATSLAGVAWTLFVSSLRRPLAFESRAYRPGKHSIHGPGANPPSSSAAAKRPLQRPDPNILSEAIRVFFIGRNRHGFWVARDADARVGGIFLRKQAAMRFADRVSQPAGCAKILLPERFELDIENKGNWLIASLGAARAVCNFSR
jgi:hypothetical protein